MKARRYLVRGSLYFSLVLAPLQSWLKTASAQPAQVQPAPRPNPQADALFKEARALIAQGNYEEACPKLEESRRIEAGMGTVFNLADCYEHIGRTSSAWASFMDVAAVADTAGMPERAQMARQRAFALASRIPKLRITVSPELAALGVEVRRDGVPIGPLVWGSDVAVDPGRHRIIATAPGRAVWSSAVDVLEPGKVVVLDVPMLRADGEAPPISESEVAPEAPPAPLKDRTARSIAPVIALGGVTLTGIGAGVGLLVTSEVKRASAASLRSNIQSGAGELNGCLASPKPASCDALDSEVRGAATLHGISIGAFIAGGLAAAGMTAYLLWPADGEHAPSSEIYVRVLPVVGFASGGLDFSAHF